MGSPGADGNTLAVSLPPTVLVTNTEEIEEILIFPHIEGKRNWEEILRDVFRDDYPSRLLDSVVLRCVQRIREGYIPTRILQRAAEVQHFHDRCALK